MRKRVRHVERGRAVQQAVHQQRLAGFGQHVRTVVRGAAIHSQSHRAAGAAQSQHGGAARSQPHVRAGTMRDPHAGAAQTRDFAAVETDPVRQPGVGIEPANIFQKIQRPLSEAVQAIRLFVASLGQVGMQPNVVTAGQSGGRAHQLRRHGKGRARRQRDPQHGARRGVVILADQPLAIRQDPAFALHHRIGWQSAFTAAHAHASARGMETNADAAGGFDFRIDQPAVAAREQVVVIGGGGAAREQQLGHSRQRRHVHGFFVEARPQGIERPQPIEQLGIGRRGARARQRLEEMMVGVDHARHGHRVAPADGAVRARQFGAAAFPPAGSLHLRCKGARRGGRCSPDP